MTRRHLRRRPLGEWEQAKRAEARRRKPPATFGRMLVVSIPQILQLAGVYAVVYGISLVSVPAAWIVAGLGVVTVIEVAGWQRRKAARHELAAAAALRMTRGDLNL